MALKPVRYGSEDFDRFVGVLIGRWEDAIESRDQWADLDEDEQAFQTEDWPVNNDIHRHLADYAADHELTDQQKAQWDKLNDLVARHKDDLETMGYRVRLPELRAGAKHGLRRAS